MCLMIMVGSVCAVVAGIRSKIAQAEARMLGAAEQDTDGDDNDGDATEHVTGRDMLAALSTMVLADSISVGADDSETSDPNANSEHAEQSAPQPQVEPTASATPHAIRVGRHDTSALSPLWSTVRLIDQMHSKQSKQKLYQARQARVQQMQRDASAGRANVTLFREQKISDARQSRRFDEVRLLLLISSFPSFAF
jgi:hypothetical protein